MLKLADALQVGPSFEPLYGFDLVITKNYAEFVMQFCEDYENIPKKIETNLKNQTKGAAGRWPYDSLKENLLESLSFLHSFNVVHLDIKHENIGWSNNKNKAIFLDFGFSKMLN